jgi:leucyl-tRNA synthetase
VLFAGEYSADATRVALADASDSNDDGNFEESSANAAILRLTRETAWIRDVVQAAESGQLRSGEERNLADRVLSNAVACCAAEAKQAYDGMMIRDALKHSMFEMLHARCAPGHPASCSVHLACGSCSVLSAHHDEYFNGISAYTTLQLMSTAHGACRDAYREQLGGEGMHADVARMYIDAFVRMLAPIAPHWADELFRNVLQAGDTVLNAGWPQAHPLTLALQCSRLCCTFG